MKKHHVEVLITEQSVRARIQQLINSLLLAYYVARLCLWRIWYAKLTCHWKLNL